MASDAWNFSLYDQQMAQERASRAAFEAMLDARQRENEIHTRNRWEAVMDSWEKDYRERRLQGQKAGEAQELERTKTKGQVEVKEVEGKKARDVAATMQPAERAALDAYISVHGEQKGLEEFWKAKNKEDIVRMQQATKEKEIESRSRSAGQKEMFGLIREQLKQQMGLPEDHPVMKILETSLMTSMLGGGGQGGGELGLGPKPAPAAEPAPTAAPAESRSYPGEPVMWVSPTGEIVQLNVRGNAGPKPQQRGTRPVPSHQTLGERSSNKRRESHVRDLLSTLYAPMG